MVPTLEIPKEELLGNGFINGYSVDQYREEQYPDSIYILFKPTDLYRFRKFLDSEYARTKSIIDDYDYEDGFVVVVYQLDAKFKPDFNIVRQGRYSKTSMKFQQLFAETITIDLGGIPREEISLQYRIFNRTKDLVEFWEAEFGMTLDAKTEVWHGYNVENETLNLEKFKEHV